MKITLKDGSVKEYECAKSVIDIAFDISEGLARAACAGEVDGKVVDLRTEISEDCTLNILTGNDAEGLRVVRHTCSHVLAEAVKRLYPNAKLAIGPAIDEGFYYDFDVENPFSREELDNIEAEMKKIIKEGNKLERFELPRAEAIKYMEEIVKTKKEDLTLEERNILSTAYKNCVSARRSAWRSIYGIEVKEKTNQSKYLVLVTDLKELLEKELSDLCHKMLQLIDNYLLAKSTSDESKVYYMKLKGDY